MRRHPGLGVLSLLDLRGQGEIPYRAIIVAHENVRTRLANGHYIAAFDTTMEPAPSIALPVMTFDNTTTFHLNGHTINAFHVPNAHTDGDVIVHFKEANVMHMGDLYFNSHYPNIDLESGGTVQAWPDTLQRVLEEPFSHVIPGHGALSDRDGIRAFARFLTQLAAVGRDAAARGLELEETLEGAVLDADAGYEEIHMIVPIGLDRDFVSTRAWEESTGRSPP